MKKHLRKFHLHCSQLQFSSISPHVQVATVTAQALVLVVALVLAVLRFLQSNFQNQVVKTLSKERLSLLILILKRHSYSAKHQ